MEQESEKSLSKAETGVLSTGRKALFYPAAHGSDFQHKCSVLQFQPRKKGFVSLPPTTCTLLTLTPKIKNEFHCHHARAFCKLMLLVNMCLHIYFPQSAVWLISDT